MANLSSSFAKKTQTGVIKKEMDTSNLLNNNFVRATSYINDPISPLNQLSLEDNRLL